MKLPSQFTVASLLFAVLVVALMAFEPVQSRHLGHRHSRRRQSNIWVRQHSTHPMVILKAAEDTSTTTVTPDGSPTAAPASSPIRQNLSFDDLYKEWSSWKRCNRKCKQVRTRVCKAAKVCGATILKEERGCTGDRCRLSTGFNGTSSGDSSHSQQPSPQESKGKGRGKNKFRVLYHLQSMIYSKWSEWSPCTSTCRTRRYRVCELTELCGSSILQEDALCYTEGSRCEHQYRKKRRQNKPEGHNDIETDITGSSSSGATVLSGNGTMLIDDETCGTPMVKDASANLRIIGGREATRGAWPWQVLILNQDLDPFCGGTLITPQFVLTAAHCVRRHRLYIRAGEHDLMSEEGAEQEVRVDMAFEHPDYDPETVDNDIALLRLRRPLKVNKYVSMACLPESGEALAVDSLGTILGWGKRKKNAVFGAETLRQAEVPIASIKDCRKVYDEYLISDNMVCAGYKRGRVDSCAGDSGGPLLYQRNGRWFVYGITSFGEGCGRKGKYGIYSRVPNFSKWIRETIQRHSPRREAASQPTIESLPSAAPAT